MSHNNHATIPYRPYHTPKLYSDTLSDRVHCNQLEFLGILLLAKTHLDHWLVGHGGSWSAHMTTTSLPSLDRNWNCERFNQTAKLPRYGKDPPTSSNLRSWRRVVCCIAVSWTVVSSRAPAALRTQNDWTEFQAADQQAHWDHCWLNYWISERFTPPNPFSILHYFLMHRFFPVSYHLIDFIIEYLFHDFSTSCHCFTHCFSFASNISKAI